MQDGTTRVLLDIDHDIEESVRRRSRHQGRAPQTVTLDPLSENYLGYAFMVRPAANADARALAAGEMPRAHWFWSVVTRFGSNYSHVAIAAFLINVLALAAPLFTMNVYDRVIPNGAIPSLIALAIGLVLAIVFDFVLRVVRSRIIDMTGKKIDVVLAAEIFEHVLSLKMAKRPQSVGILANQMRDFDSVREFFTSGTVVSVTDLLFALIFIAVLFIVAGPLAWIPLIMLPLMIAVGFLLQRPLDRAMKRLQAESAARHGVLVESLSGMETVRASGAEARMQTAWERSVAATARSGEDVNFWASLALTASATAQQVTNLLMVLVGVFLVLDGKLSVGALVAATMLAGRVLGPIARHRRGDHARDADPHGTQGHRSPDGTRTRASAGKDLCRAQHRQGRDRLRQCLLQVSRRRRPGARKSVVPHPARRTRRHDRPRSARARPRSAACSRVSTTPTRAAFSSTASISANMTRRICAPASASCCRTLNCSSASCATTSPSAGPRRPMKKCSTPRVWPASRASSAGHPEGYDMQIAEGGRSLSGGQKQAIGLARTLIRNPKILFLDEPTAHFDARSEAEFIERLQALAKGDMTIMISTHRATLLPTVDRLMVFDKGKLALDGPRDQVLARLRGGDGKASHAPV